MTNPELIRKLHLNMADYKPISSAEDAFKVEREAYERLLKVNEKFRKALNAIARSSQCIYEGTYGEGVAEGHRRAALIAKEALNEND